MSKKRKQKKQYVIEQGIFEIYPDFPIMLIDKAALETEESPLHFHYYLEIGCCIKGRCLFNSNQKSFEVGENDITITASDILHTMQKTEQETKMSYIYIDFDALVKMFPVGEARTQLIFAKTMVQDIFCINGKENPDMIWIIKEVFHLYNEKPFAYKMQIVALMYIFLLKVNGIYNDDDMGNSGNDSLLIMPAINYIYDHYMEKIKVSHLAKECHFSESYFRKVFQEMKGMTPMDYVNSIRIREARGMLLNTTKSVHVIGEKCGFSSITTFERNFKKRTGMLPSQWRESQKNPRIKDKNAHIIKRSYH